MWDAHPAVQLDDHTFPMMLIRWLMTVLNTQNNNKYIVRIYQKCNNISIILINVTQLYPILLGNLFAI